MSLTCPKGVPDRRKAETAIAKNGPRIPVREKCARERVLPRSRQPAGPVRPLLMCAYERCRAAAPATCARDSRASLSREEGRHRGKSRRAKPAVAEDP